MSHPFERILLATEHTEFDAGAERVAFALALRCGVSLRAVLPVVSNPEFEAIAPQIAERDEREAAFKMQQLRDEASEQAVDFDIEARRGEEPYREIVQAAADCNADLIVIRRRGKRSFISDLLVGEMVMKVVAHAPCSVLLVPRAARMWSQGVLAAVDSSVSAKHVASVAAKIAHQCALPLTVVSVATHEAVRIEAEGTLAHAVAVANAAGAHTAGRALTGKPFEQILGEAKRSSSDLIVVGRHGETNLIRTPFGGTTQKVVGLADVPVLAVHVRP